MKTTNRANSRKPLPQTLPELQGLRILERPDGFYWECAGCRREHGPFATRLEAEQHMELYDDDTLEVGETLEEAEAELGISGWIDPDTGELAEGEVSRIEEH